MAAPPEPPMSRTVYNFSAGPATLPSEVLEEARRELVSYRGRGLSVMEMSHRSSAYDEIHRQALAALRRLLGVPESHSVLLLQGGATLQFSMLPMNLLPSGGSADYVLTGSWSQKALAEARKRGSVRVAASGEEGGFRRLPGPDELDLDPAAAYVHLTTNNTICGTQWHELPEAGDAPLALDMSSDVLARPIPWARVGIAYAGAQKNLGPAGVTLVVVRDDLAERAPGDLPAMLDYRVHAGKGSLYNTPPCWAIYVLGLCCRWVEARGGLTGMAAAAERRAEQLYRLLDGGDFYRGTAEPAARSRMNVTFRLPSEELEARFLAAAADRGLIHLKGHRSVGGIRASLYNAMPDAGVDALIEHMNDFRRREG